MRSRVLFFLLAVTLASALYAGRTRGARRTESNGPTFNKEIVRIFQQNCQTCHRPGDIAPFSLLTYTDAKPWASNIKFMTQTRQMPPWKPEEGCGEFRDARRLSQAEIDLIARWADGGAPEGNATDLPPTREFPSEWALGEPDLTLQPPQPYTATGSSDVYRCFPIDAQATEDRYVAAVDVRPGNRQKVHHVIAFLDTTGESAALDASDPGPGYPCFGGPGFNATGALGGWAPGARPYFLPDGVALSLPRGAKVILQVHYHPEGGEGADQTQIALYFSKPPVRKLMRILPLWNRSLVIPPEAANHQVDASFTIPFFLAAHALSITPHMHLLGRKMKVEAVLPNGSTTCLIDIQDWDFNWQGTYVFKDPVPLGGNTKVELTAFYDNSLANPKNPNNPPKEVRWGEETTDEMCLAFIGFTIDSEDLTSQQKLPSDESWIPPLFPPR